MAAIRPASPARRYARAFGKLRKAGIPNGRALLLEQMAAAMDDMSAAGNRDDARCEDLFRAANVLRQVAASERGWVLLPPDAEEVTAEEVRLWRRLATAWDHRDRAGVLDWMRDELGFGPAVRSALDDAAVAERAVAGQPPARPVMMP